MSRFSFDPEKLRTALSLAKLVKSKTKDLSFTFSENGLIIFSYDDRRWSCARIRSEESHPGFQSSEFYITLDRTALFESDLNSIRISVNQKSLTVKATDGDQERSANLKKRSIRSKRASVPEAPNIDYSSVNVDLLTEFLTQASCSALVKETKTEEEMRINQVHFYPDSGFSHAISNARYYGSLVKVNGIEMDLSIVSADIPIIKNFASRIKSENVDIGFDKYKIYFRDPSTSSLLSLSRIPTKKPPLTLLDSSKFQTLVLVEKEQLMKSLAWAQMAIEGTLRLTVDCDGATNEMSLLNGSEQISKIPIEFKKGQELKADFPVTHFHQIIKHIDGQVALGYDHPETPRILGVYEYDRKNPVEYTHFVSSMVTR